MNFILDSEVKANLDRVISIGAIVLPLLCPGEKCNITSTMIQLLTVKILFREMTGNDPNMHLMNFLGICNSFDFPGVSQNSILLRLFPLYLFGEVTLRLTKLPPDFITN